MNEFKLFVGFFWDAIPTVFRNRVAFLFGVLLTLSSLEYFPSLLEEGAPLEWYRDAVAGFFTAHPELLILSPVMIALATFFKGGLILSLAERKPSFRKIARRVASSFWKLYALELSVLLLFFILLAALLLPAMLTADTPGLWRNLAFLGIAVFLPISIVIALVEIYAFFHLLLSKTTLRSSVELAYSLFVRRAATSIVFGAVSILVLITFSVIIGLVLGTSAALIPVSVGGTIFGIVVFLLLQSAMTVIQNGAWLSFFRFIATPEEPAQIEVEDKASQKEKNVIQKEVPDIG